MANTYTLKFRQVCMSCILLSDTNILCGSTEEYQTWIGHSYSALDLQCCWWQSQYQTWMWGSPAAKRCTGWGGQTSGQHWTTFSCKEMLFLTHKTTLYWSKLSDTAVLARLVSLLQCAHMTSWHKLQESGCLGPNICSKFLLSNMLAECLLQTPCLFPAWAIALLHFDSSLKGVLVSHSPMWECMRLPVLKYITTIN